MFRRVKVILFCFLFVLSCVYEPFEWNILSVQIIYSLLLKKRERHRSFVEFKFIWPSLVCHISQLSTLVTFKEKLQNILVEEKGIRLNLNKLSQIYTSIKKPCLVITTLLDSKTTL